MAEDAVKKYLATTNRPYSANDIVMNLHKQYGKTAVQRALDYLVGENVVLEKTYGKQKVYVIKQDPNDCPAPNEIQELEESLQNHVQELKEFKDKLKTTEAELENMRNTLSMSDLMKKINSMNAELEDIKQKLGFLKNTSVPISPRKFKKAEDDKIEIIKEFRKRKRICMDIINTIAESYPKSKRELFEEIGIETDEDVGFPTKELIKD